MSTEPADDDLLHVGPRLAIPVADVRLRAVTSGGPGGQHANRSHTGIVVTLDLATCRGPSDEERSRLIERLGPVVSVRSTEHRSQQRNRDAALTRLTRRLADALITAPPRRPSRRTKASVERRLDAKRRQSVRKADRRRPTSEE